MSAPKRVRTPAAQTIAQFDRRVIYRGYGHAAWPSYTEPGLMYSLTISGDRKSVSCGCAEFATLAKGQLCKHGVEAIKLAKSYIAKHKLWEKPFAISLATTNAEAATTTRRAKQIPYSGIRRSPATVYQFPDGGKKKSRENRARRAWSERVPQLLDDLREASIERLDRKMLFSRRRRNGRVSIGKGRVGYGPFHRLYAVIARSCSRSLVQHAGDMADNKRVIKLLGVTPKEGSIQNYFHDTFVLWGLKLWLAMTARTVQKIARYAIVDSTAFATSFVEVWRESEHGKNKVRVTSTWLKAHVLSDAATNMIGAIIATSNRGRSADVRWLKGLITLARYAGWRPDAILGDKAYFSKNLRDWCETVKMLLFVPLKEGLTETTREAWDKHNRVLSEPSSFHRIMRYRSKVESVFSAWKRMFDPEAFARITKKHPPRRSGLSISQEIELYAKAVTYNLRRIATLEEVLGQRISFTKGYYFDPMPDGWVSPESSPSLLTNPDLLDDAA